MILAPIRNHTKKRFLDHEIMRNALDFTSYSHTKASKTLFFAHPDDKGWDEREVPGKHLIIHTIRQERGPLSIYRGAQGCATLRVHKNIFKEYIITSHSIDR